MKALGKSLLLILVIFVLVIFIAACNKKQTTKLRVGTNAEYPPFEYKEGDSFVGVDMDLARKLAEKLEMEFEIVDMDFDALIPSLIHNKIDLAISAITITDERKARVDFSPPYYIANQVIITRKDSKLNLSKLEDIVKYRIGAQNETTGESYLTENYVDTHLMSSDNLKTYATNIEAITDLQNGFLDFVIIDDSAAQGYANLRPIKTVLTIETSESYGIAMPKGGKLNRKVNKALQELIDGGEMISIIQTHVR